jgi:hypothetical protein
MTVAKIFCRYRFVRFAKRLRKGIVLQIYPPLPRYTNNLPASNEPSTCLTAISTARPADLVPFHHAALFSPAPTTLELALQKGFLPPFPGLTLQALRRHPPHSVATIKGHLDQIRKNLRSTKKAPKESPTTSVSNTDEVDDWFPASEPSNKRTHHYYLALIKPERSGQIYSDLTGRFPIAPSKENNYLLINYDYDSNGILAQPMQTRTGPCILAAYKVLHECLVAAGLRPQLQHLNHENSQSLKQFMTSESADYQLVPPDVHCWNAAKRAIRTFTKHFIAGLCSTDKNCPLHLWDNLVPQAEPTLNMLQGSRVNTKVSALTQLNGRFKELTEVLASVTVPDLEAPSNPEPIAPLRVGDHHLTNTSIEETAPPLRVDTPTPLVPEPTKVHFALSPSETMQPTFTHSTGIQGQQCCRAQRKQQPLSSSATIHPKRHTRQNPVPVSNHSYATRSKSK